MKKKKAADYIEPLYMNGLQGRMLRLPASRGKKREILLIYGHHASLERMFGVAEELNRYGAVTMPDLPGFGGMQSFYRIHESATLDNLADYLAAFVKLRYKHKKVTILGLSFGFVIVTRMLQRCPDLAKNVDLLISGVGFAHKDDFTFSKPRYYFYLLGSRFFSHRLPAIFFRNVCLHPMILRLVYDKTHNAKQKFQNMTPEQRRTIMDFEIYLWHCNDVRTYMKTTVEFLTLDNCQKRVPLPVWHISVKADRYFDNRLVEQHMRVIFTNFHEVKAKMDTHAPSVVADAEAAAPLIPRKIRTMLSQ